MVGIALADDTGNACHSRWFGIGVIKEDAVARFHVITHEIPRLIVAYARPVGCTIALKIIDRIAGGFGF
jgi:hypothetical protein